MKTKFKSFLNEKLTSEIAKEIAFELGEEINKKLGGGAYGVAFSTKSGKVLKLTNDSDEFNRAYALSRTKYKTKYLINYYNVGRIISSNVPGRNSAYSYYLLMDQVLPLSEIEHKIISNSSDIVDEIVNNDDSPTTKEDYLNNIANVFKYSNYHNISEIEEIELGNLYDNIVNIAKELKKHKMQSVDFHGGNVGWDKDRKYLIFFDIGGYMPKSYNRNNKKILIR